MKIREKLLAIQLGLKVSKEKNNGKFRYRTCEDILEAVKPLLQDQNATLTLEDEIVEAGGHVYVKAKALLVNNEGTDNVKVTALAREDEAIKGNFSSQLTGMASSYARKYALSGLFLIDDSKDADSEMAVLKSKVVENLQQLIKYGLEKDNAKAALKDVEKMDVHRLQKALEWTEQVGMKLWRQEQS